MSQAETLTRLQVSGGSEETPFKTLLLHVSNEPANRARLRLGVEFALRYEAHLLGVGCPLSPASDPWLGFMDGTVLQLLMDDQRSELAKCKAFFRECVAPLGERAHWTEQNDFVSRSLAEHAAVADLVICGPERGPAASTGDASDIVFDCGLPVLMLPAHVCELRFKRIVVAWRDKPEARRAVSAALPLLKQAASVLLLSVESESDERAEYGLNAVRTRLDRHGVACTPLIRRGAEDQAPQIILEAAQDHGADLIVLGAYGHSRARECILGGVTQGLLQETSTPLFLMR